MYKKNDYVEILPNEKNIKYEFLVGKSFKVSDSPAYNNLNNITYDLALEYTDDLYIWCNNNEVRPSRFLEFPIYKVLTEVEDV
jgi:hypothetical protein